MKFKIPFLFSICFLLSACAGITYHAEPPQVSISNIQLVEAQLFEQRYELTLRVQNTNDFPLFIKGLSYQLHINGSKFAHGVSKQSIDVLPYEEQMLTVTLISNTLGLIKHLKSLNNKALNFRLTGHVSHGTVANPISLYNLPFEKSGTLDLSGLLSK
ncbi:MAG: Water stress and hypersensitive response domain-containing protein [Cycloclasticus sp. symbiont of Bathymodiolus heckerae]|nr:MAG: Water stress and hypersensitive response domain-containing protein [Cycloclasticus sp. symbiont of Bathymodiolus heckerae]